MLKLWPDGSTTLSGLKQRAQLFLWREIACAGAFGRLPRQLFNQVISQSRSGQNSERGRNHGEVVVQDSTMKRQTKPSGSATLPKPSRRTSGVQAVLSGLSSLGWVNVVLILRVIAVGSVGGVP